MAIELSTKTLAIISEMVSNGRFASEREVLEQGVLLVWQAEMRESIREGLAAIERGEGYEMDDAFWSDVIRESDQDVVPDRSSR